MVVLEKLVDVVVLVDARDPENCKSRDSFGHIHPLAPDEPVCNHVPCSQELLEPVCFLHLQQSNKYTASAWPQRSFLLT